jgi:hypothetical protein
MDLALQERRRDPHATARENFRLARKSHRVALFMQENEQVTLSLGARMPKSVIMPRAVVARRCASAALGFVLGVGAIVGLSTIAAADEGGVSVWLPGFFGSLAAAPLQPGWSLQSATLRWNSGVNNYMTLCFW